MVYRRQILTYKDDPSIERVNPMIPTFPQYNLYTFVCPLFDISSLRKVIFAGLNQLKFILKCSLFTWYAILEDVTVLY